MSELPQGPDISSYSLPITDVDTTKRNFPGYAMEMEYSLEEIIAGDSSGTTETDSKTYPKGSGGYSKINQKP